jgi:hypothetical protein
MPLQRDNDWEPLGAEAVVTLRSASFGATLVSLPTELAEVPFRLGPLAGKALLTAVTTTGTAPARETTWELRLVPDGDWSPADLLEAFGAEVSR